MYTSANSPGSCSETVAKMQDASILKLANHTTLWLNRFLIASKKQFDKQGNLLFGLIQLESDSNKIAFLLLKTDLMSNNNQRGL